MHHKYVAKLLVKRNAEPLAWICYTQVVESRHLWRVYEISNYRNFKETKKKERRDNVHILHLKSPPEVSSNAPNKNSQFNFACVYIHTCTNIHKVWLNLATWKRFLAKTLAWRYVVAQEKEIYSEVFHAKIAMWLWGSFHYLGSFNMNVCQSTQLLWHFTTLKFCS